MQHIDSSAVEPTDTAPPPPPAANDSQPATETHRFHFSGSGGEYFRIWIVNLLLSIVTLGAYSAWAKVRRMQYFNRNTHLAGAVFEFDGDPKAILKGRVLAVVLLLAYQFSFGFSLTAGVAVVLILLIGLPYSMRGALRFRMHNTRYRGLRLHFSGTPAGAYAAYLPAMVMFLLPAILIALDPSGKTVLWSTILYLFWPLMHGSMKRYQHGNLNYGSLAASFDVPKRRFYRPDLVSAGFGMLGSLVAGIVIAMCIGVSMTVLKDAPEMSKFVMIASIVVTMYLVYLVSGPYLLVRIGNLVWSNTSFPGITIKSNMDVGSYMTLQLGNTVMTLLTLGLFRPFAAVRTYKYRLAHLSVTTEGSFEQALAGAAGAGVSANADGVAEFIGADISW